MKNYLKRTWKNKLIAAVLASLGYASTLLAGDGTAFALILMFTVPLFFTKHNVFEM